MAGHMHALHIVRATFLSSPPRARILHKYAQYSVIIVYTDGAAAIQHLISSPSGANSYQGQPSPISAQSTSANSHPVT